MAALKKLLEESKRKRDSLDEKVLKVRRHNITVSLNKRRKGCFVL